jgi:low affinity Fe/Cu permease
MIIICTAFIVFCMACSEDHQNKQFARIEKKLDEILNKKP